MSKIASSFSRKYPYYAGYVGILTQPGLVRFIPRSNRSSILIGEPVDPKLDVGLALYQGKDVPVHPFSGPSVLNPGQKTEETEIIERLLSPLAQNEVGSIRCIGLNVSTRNESIKICIDRTRSMSPTPQK